jgi:hypothetical protein
MRVTQRLTVLAATPNRMLAIGECAPKELRQSAQRVVLVLEHLVQGLLVEVHQSRSPMAMTPVSETTRPWTLLTAGQSKSMR